MSYDFNGADRQQSYDPIPAGTIVPLSMNIRPGGAGDGGWLKQSNNSDALMLDCEFIVTEGPYLRRKLWQFMVLSGGKLNEKGDSVAGNISRATLRAMLESARGIIPDDHSEQAVNARRVNGWQDFCGLVFLAKLGVEKDKSGQYADKNRIMAVITPDMKDYSGGGHSDQSGTAPVQAPSPAPAWAVSASAAPQTAAAPAWSGQPGASAPTTPVPAAASAAILTASPAQSSPQADVQSSEKGFVPPPAPSAAPVPAWAR